MSLPLKPAIVNLTVNITQFRVLGGVFPISATYTATSSSPNVRVINGNIIVKGRDPASFVFQLPQPGYVFVGATFVAPGTAGDVGVTEFPMIVIDRTSKGNSLTITDANVAQNVDKVFSYILLVQNTLTGEIGLIDPAIVSEPL
jgi:hypothetical protein